MRLLGGGWSSEWFYPMSYFESSQQSRARTSLVSGALFTLRSYILTVKHVNIVAFKPHLNVSYI